MASTWDRRSARANAAMQDELVRDQVRAIASAAPWWKRQFAALGRDPQSISSVAALSTVPAVGERDVSPNGDPAAMAGLVSHGSEHQFTLTATGPQLRRALWLRAVRRDDYRLVVDSETKPTSYLWSGLGFRYLLASTRGDLDVVARAGARLWHVLGLTDADALLSAVPVAATTEHVALQHAALAAGAPALFPGDGLVSLAAAARLAPPTVLAVPTGNALEVLAALALPNGGLDRLRTVLLVGAPTDEQRAGVRQALIDAGHAEAAVLAVHAPAGARVLWGECVESGGDSGLHTYPDLEVVQVVDPDTGEPAVGAGELVLSQLGLKGSALLRWRTGDLTAGVESQDCPACGRTVPRVTRLQSHPLVVTTSAGRTLDLRSLAGALSGRGDLADWRVVVGGRARDGQPQVVVHLASDADPGEAAVAAATDIRAVAGVLPTQIVATGLAELANVAGTPLTSRVLTRLG